MLCFYTVLSPSLPVIDVAKLHLLWVQTIFSAMSPQSTRKQKSGDTNQSYNKISLYLSMYLPLLEIFVCSFNFVTIWYPFILT